MVVQSTHHSTNVRVFLLIKILIKILINFSLFVGTLYHASSHRATFFPFFLFLPDWSVLATSMLPILYF